MGEYTNTLKSLSNLLKFIREVHTILNSLSHKEDLLPSMRRQKETELGQIKGNLDRYVQQVERAAQWAIGLSDTPAILITHYLGETKKTVLVFHASVKCEEWGNTVEIVKGLIKSTSKIIGKFRSQYD